jgi:hypothetical protein
LNFERRNNVSKKNHTLKGRCDEVEFHSDGTVYPVEYKHGKKQKWLNDDLQLAAQAICLEEMLNIRIERGAIFHKASMHRRVHPQPENAITRFAHKYDRYRTCYVVTPAWKTTARSSVLPTKADWSIYCRFLLSYLVPLCKGPSGA